MASIVELAQGSLRYRYSRAILEETPDGDISYPLEIDRRHPRLEERQLKHLPA